MESTALFDLDQKEYWAEHFQVTDEDLEYIFNLFLETETPQGLRELTLRLIQSRIEKHEREFERYISNSEIFKPAKKYEIGEKLIFTALDFAVGEVVAKRPGNNPNHSTFAVIEVLFEDGKRREFASELGTEHPLNRNNATLVQQKPDAEKILRVHGKSIARKLRERFEKEKDVVYLAGRWFLKSLLMELDLGSLHLAEAVLDINGGGPMSTAQIAREIGMEMQVNERLHLFSMDYALQQDPRFDEVGPAGEVLWYLNRMEPDAVKTTPIPLRYEPIPYQRSALREDLLQIEAEIDDELSPLESPEDEPDSVTITLTYPYRRTGTLPLSARLQHLFPTAFETTRVRTILVDAQSNEEVPGWVVRSQGYVYGLEEFYQKYRIPIGAYVTVRRDLHDPTKLILDFASRKPRTEWIRLAVPEGNRLTFQNHRRSIGAEYDDLMIFGIEDLGGVDAMWVKMQHYAVDDILKMLIPELTKLTPQQTVHVKTLYSAFNLIRRCPPAPIFAALTTNPIFEHVAGPYWHMA